jgi:hypothetical protein
MSTCVLVLVRAGMAMIVSPSKSRSNPCQHSSWCHTRCSRSHSLGCTGGCLWCGDLCLQRPSIRASSYARHPMLSAFFDAGWKAQRRRPHLYDGVLRRPRISAGRLYQHQGIGVLRHRPSVYPSLSIAPAGNTPVSRKRQSAISNLRATATIPIRRKRLPPLPKR